MDKFILQLVVLSLVVACSQAGNLGYGAGLGLAAGGVGHAAGLGLGLAGAGYGGLGPVGYGGVGLGVGGVGLGAGGLGVGGFGVGVGLANHAPGGPLPAAIRSVRTYEVRDVPLPKEPAVVQTIDVEPSEQPVEVIFRSISSPVLVKQIHTPGAPGQIERTSSEDEPHRVLHEVLRPVIQEVREVIQPYRRVTQEVRPVLEEVHTVVAKGEPRLRGAIAPVAVDAEYGGAVGSIAHGGEALALDGYAGEGLALAGGYGGEGLAIGGGYGGEVLVGGKGGYGLGVGGLKGGYRRKAARKAARKA